MKRIRFIPAQVKTVPDDRPTACPHCGGGILSKHGSAEKPVKDIRVETVTVHRYLCQSCGRTFRHYPQGIDRGGQSQRMRGWAALMWALGLSLRSASHALAAVGESLSHTSVWRDVQEAGENARRRLAKQARGRVRVIGADETFVKVKGDETALGLVTDAETGQVIGMDVLVERDSDAFLAWLGEYVDEFGVEAMVTDDLNTYKPVAERLGLDHQICVAHVLRWAWNRLGKKEEWDWIKTWIWRLLKELPLDGGLDLLRLERLVRDDEDQTVRRLCVELSNKWRALLCHRRRGGVPRTNNVTERAIGRSKIRSRSTRGYKSESGLLNGFWLTQWAWSGSDGLELSELVAA